MHAFVIFCSLLMIAISVNLEWMGPLFLRSEGYAEGLYIVPVLLMGYLLLGVYFNLSIWFKITDKTQYSFWITFIGALVSIAVVILLVPVYGFMGAALSTLACYVVMSVICFVFGQKFYPIPYQTGKDLAYLLIAFGLSYLGFWFSTESEILSFFLKNAFLIPFIILILVLERKELSRFLAKKG